MKPKLITQLKKAPMLVASLDGDDLPYLLEQARTERADLAEIRMDLWETYMREDMIGKMTRFKEKIGLPLLVSFRGGNPFPAWWQPMHWRALAQVDLIDVEWNPKYPWRQILQNSRKAGVPLMISHHDYKETPSQKVLLRIARAAYAKKADIVKIATRVKTEEDIRTLFQVNRSFAPRRLMTVMGMGPLGTVSRLSAPLFDACLIYGYIGTPTANGQLPFRELQERIRALYPRYEESFQARQLERVQVGAEP